MKKASVGIVVLSVFLATTGESCKNTSDARSLWKDVLQKCAVTDLMSENPLFLGVSNTFGPGTILRMSANGAYTPAWTEPMVGYPPGVLNPGKETTCTGTREVRTDLSPSLDVGALVPGLTVGASADFKRGKKVTISIDSWQMDSLISGPVTEAIREKKIKEEVWNDLTGNNRFAINSAILVHGITSKITYDKTTAAELKVKYGVPGGVDIGAGLKASISDTGELVITSKNKFYIAGDILAINTEGLAGQTELLTRVSGLDKARFEK